MSFSLTSSIRDFKPMNEAEARIKQETLAERKRAKYESNRRRLVNRLANSTGKGKGK